MKIVVTGGTGFIGSHVNRLLLEAGHKVTVVDNLSKSHKESLDPRINFFQADINDQPTLEKILPGHDAVVHMASYIEVGESVKNPVSFVENNILGTVKLLEAMKNTKVNKMIFSSSACVYGRPTKVPLSEDDPLQEQENPYGLTKHSMEQLCALYHKLFGLDVTILRYFNPYGPREQHEPETHAIPNFIKAVLTKTPIPLFWGGQQIRDFIYIEDLARAHLLTLPLTGKHYFNVGTESVVKVIDVIKTIFEIVGYEVPIEDKGERKGDVPTLVASSQKIQKELGWKPKTNLQKGLRKTIEFFKESS